MCYGRGYIGLNFGVIYFAGLLLIVMPLRWVV